MTAALTFALVRAIGWALFERIDKIAYREACERLEREVMR